MIKLEFTRLSRMSQEKLASATVIGEEGVPLDSIKENGERVVTLAAGGLFAGIALARNYPPSLLPDFVTGKIDPSGSLELAHTPVTGQILVKINGTVAAVGSNAGQYQIAGNVIAFNVADVGKTYAVQTMYAPTVEEARQLVGDMPYGGQSANLVGEVTTIKTGEVATSFFDASADWTNVLYVKTDNGRFVPGTASDHIAGVVVNNAPNVGNPFLVIELNVA